MPDNLNTVIDQYWDNDISNSLNIDQKSPFLIENHNQIDYIAISDKNFIINNYNKIGQIYGYYLKIVVKLEQSPESNICINKISVSSESSVSIQPVKVQTNINEINLFYKSELICQRIL